MIPPRASRIGALSRSVNLGPDSLMTTIPCHADFGRQNRPARMLAAAQKNAPSSNLRARIINMTRQH
jgi:hypothetical protein